MTTTIRRIAAFTLFALGVLTGAAVTAPQANADPASYINQLNNDSVANYTGQTSWALNLGYKVCADVIAGYSPGVIIHNLYVHNNLDMIAAQEMYYVAVEDLC